MKKLALLVLFTFLLATQPGSIHIRRTSAPAADCAASPNNTDCLYYQDFETGGATANCTAESPVMDTGNNCAYATAPAPIAGSYSAMVDDVISDQSSFTISSGTTVYGYLRMIVTDNSSDGNVEFLQAYNGTTATNPRIRVGSRSFPDLFQFRMYCDETFSGEGTAYTAESVQFSGDDSLQLWWNYNNSTAVGQLKILGGSECPTVGTTGCTLTCDGVGTTVMDGFKFPLSGTLAGTYIVDNIIFDDAALSTEP